MEKSAVELFNELLIQNNLQVNLSTPIIRYLQGGGILVEKSDIVVTYSTPPSQSPLKINKKSK